MEGNVVKEALPTEVLVHQDAVLRDQSHLQEEGGVMDKVMMPSQISNYRSQANIKENVLGGSNEIGIQSNQIDSKQDQTLHDEAFCNNKDNLRDEDLTQRELRDDELTQQDTSAQDQLRRRQEGDKANMVRRLALNPNKAGMQGVDKEKVNKTIYAMSKGSRFFNNQEERDATTQIKVQKMKQQFARFQADGTLKRKALLETVENTIAKLEEERDLSRVIVHCDMDAFYASVEELDNPALKGIPMAVGGIGMLTTCNYEARKYGVRSAMPGYIALQLCPHLKLVKGNHPRYKEISNQTREVFARYDPDFSSVGLDEAYIDVTDHLHTLHLQGETITAEELVAQMRQEVFTTTGITCSAGITANRMLSKVCSDLNKPNGQYSLPRTRKAILTFLQPLPIRKISGIGKVSEQILNGLGITTCGDMYNMLGALSLMFQPSSFGFFSRVSLGIGRTRPEARERKSIGHERTFGEQTSANEQMATCHNLCRAVARDMKKLGLKGRTITLKLKFTDFKVITRAASLTDPTQSLTVISAETRRLLTKEQTRGGILKLRLLGVRITHLAGVDESESCAENTPVQKNITSYFGSAQRWSPSKEGLRKQKLVSGNSIDYDTSHDTMLESGLVSGDSGMSYASANHSCIDDNDQSSQDIAEVYQTACLTITGVGEDTKDISSGTTGDSTLVDVGHPSTISGMSKNTSHANEDAWGRKDSSELYLENAGSRDRPLALKTDMRLANEMKVAAMVMTGNLRVLQHEETFGDESLDTTRQACERVSSPKPCDSRTLENRGEVAVVGETNMRGKSRAREEKETGGQSEAEMEGSTPSVEYINIDSNAFQSENGGTTSNRAIGGGAGDKSTTQPQSIKATHANRIDTAPGLKRSIATGSGVCDTASDRPTSAKKHKSTQLERWLTSNSRAPRMDPRLPETPSPTIAEIPGGVSVGEAACRSSKDRVTPKDEKQATKLPMKKGTLISMYQGADTARRKLPSKLDQPTKVSSEAARGKHNQVDSYADVGASKLSAHKETRPIKRKAVPCPICGVDLSTKENSSINQHVDLCLNREQISLRPP